jgi:Cofactor assembly of complex C subunit B, CCB2/CCB4
MAKPDPDRVLRQLPLVAGILGSSLLLTNRWLTPELTNSQSRSDVLGVILSALLILTGLIWQRVQPRSPDAVTLIGAEGFELNPTLPDAVKTELAWASHILLTNTVTRSLVVWYDGQILLRRGILAPKIDLQPGPILKRVLEKQQPVYLVSLPIYPGRVEFDYLPANTQGVICQPIGDQGALILAAQAPRSYTRQDENWVEAIASKLADTLNRHGVELSQPVPTDQQTKTAEPA